jgi:Activator of Hsp90 ATPase homolog 1-like protein
MNSKTKEATMARAHDIKSGIKTEPLVISRTFAAPRDLVFRAWSSAEHMKRWFSPEGCSVPEAEIDFRAGGVFAVRMHLPTGEDHWARGAFDEVSPPDGWCSRPPSCSTAKRGSTSTPSSPSRTTATGRA